MLGVSILQACDENGPGNFPRPLHAAHVVLAGSYARAPAINRHRFRLDLSAAVTRTPLSSCRRHVWLMP